MKLSLKEWVLFAFLAMLCFGLWYKLSYPEFAFVDLSIDRKEAIKRAEAYLGSLGLLRRDDLKAAAFVSDDWSDRYLQKTIGLKKEEQFFKEQGFELFSWQVRFFKELKKEEFLVMISPKSGKVMAFKHLIEDVEQRDTLEKEKARGKAESFFKKIYGAEFAKYELNDESSRRYEHRTDYSFSWEKKAARIPWGKNEGAAKLLIGATVTGNEIREFYGPNLDIPEKFQRFIENQLVFGEYLSSFSFLALLCLLIWAAYIVVKRQHNFIVRFAKNWYIRLGLFFLFIHLVYILNNSQTLIINCPTTTRLLPFIGINLVRMTMGLLFLSFAFIIPGLAGESLRSEVFPDKKYSSFLYYLKSTWLSRSMVNSVFLGYLLFLIMIGLQSAIFYFGQKYLGVWKEWIILSQLSSAYLPFLSAFIVAIGASISEEITYRLFGISWGKKYLKNTVLAVLISSLIWGAGHSRYAIFPIWFRAIEVTLLGCMFGFIFLRYGLIPLVVAHYLFDAFWGTAAHLLGRSPAYLFIGSLCVLTWPLIFALFAYFKHQEEKEREIKLMLSATQKYNLDILINFVSQKKAEGVIKEQIKAELINHNWDISLIELALNQIYGEG